MNLHAELSDSSLARIAHKRTFTARDGANIFYRYWPVNGDARARGAVVLLHRGHEHGKRLAHLVEESGLGDFAFYAWDMRGHGLSADNPLHDIATAAADLDRFVRDISIRDGFMCSDIALVGQSLGAVVGAAWVHDYAPDIGAMVLAAPAFDIDLKVPLARSALALWRKIRGPYRVASYVRAEMLTRDPQRAASYRSDPLIDLSISVDLLLDVYATSRRLIADAPVVHTPSLVLIAGADAVVRAKAQNRYFDRLGSASKSRKVLAGAYHDIFSDLDRADAIGELRRFVLAAFQRERQAPQLLGADQAGPTRAEADALAMPLARWSPSGVRWRFTRWLLKMGSAFSRGLALGHEAGFDSGSMLDYVYRNQPEGRGPVGRAVDRAYLNAVGWRGIRQRKRNLETMIGDALGRLAEAGKPRHVVDIAAGHGRYVLDALQRSPARANSVLLRDFSAPNVTAGQELIAERGLAEIARFEHGDAFDGADLAGLQPRPTLAVVSGLYELFSDNEQVLASLNGLAAAMPIGGFLVYTNQPWHPQIEMIGRALTSHRGGEPWVMRRRSQMEMDQLVAAAGFRKIDQQVDRWGIFTVSVAERIG